jgi:sortase A
MRHPQPFDYLTEAEILNLLKKKQKPDYQDRLMKYRRSGRVLIFSGDMEESPCLSNSSRSAQPSIDQETARKWKGTSLVNQTLRFVEITIIVLLLGGAGYGAKVLSHLNQQSASQWSLLPKMTPTPIIAAIILPDGHTPPDSLGYTQPNDQEIPSHLRAVVAAYANLPTPTAAPHQGIRIQIPALQIDAPLIQGDGWEQLKKGVAQHLGTANPGEMGNMVLSGHNDVFGEVFRYLDRLKPGDTITIYTFTKVYTYTVTGWTLVAPTQVDTMAPTSDATLTLISCYPYLVDNQRIIVKAKLTSE